MITLVKCLVYPKIDLGKLGDKPRYLMVRDFFPDPVLNDEFKVNAPPNEVLNQILCVNYLRDYLGIKPWIVDISKDRGYLDISEIDGKRADGTIMDLLDHEGFSIARRPYRLDEQRTNNLIDNIMEELKSDNIFGVFISRENTKLSSRVYSDVLRALGRDVSQEQIEQMISVQHQGLDDYNRALRQREAENWSILAHQVVGAEV